MEFTNPNQFEKVRRSEGFRDYDDIWDFEIFDDIKGDIEKSSPNIRELTEEHHLDIETRRCLYKTRVFCNELSEEFKQTFLSLLDRYKNEHRHFSQKIVDYLLENNFDLPNFTIADKKRAYELLTEFEMDVEIDGKNLLLVFQLPKPLAHFWWKGGADSWGSLSEDVQGTVIEWGHFYRELMPIVWQEQGRYENEEGLRFYRINDIGEHNPEKFYYIWEVSEWKNEERNEWT